MARGQKGGRKEKTDSRGEKQWIIKMFQTSSALWRARGWINCFPNSPLMNDGCQPFSFSLSLLIKSQEVGNAREKSRDFGQQTRQTFFWRRQTGGFHETYRLIPYFLLFSPVDRPSTMAMHAIVYPIDIFCKEIRLFTYISVSIITLAGWDKIATAGGEHTIPFPIFLFFFFFSFLFPFGPRRRTLENSAIISTHLVSGLSSPLSLSLWRYDYYLDDIDGGRELLRFFVYQDLLHLLLFLRAQYGLYLSVAPASLL